jgi:hypothetical protein
MVVAVKEVLVSGVASIDPTSEDRFTIHAMISS